MLQHVDIIKTIQLLNILRQAVGEKSTEFQYNHEVLLKFFLSNHIDHIMYKFLLKLK